MKIDFDLVVPHYKDEIYLSEFLHDVLSYNFKFKPNNIYILNDGESSDDFLKVCSEYSNYLPIKAYEFEQSGHVSLLNNFLMGLDSENVLISHCDVGLMPNNASVKFVDAISVLAFYLCTSENISGISCNSLFNGSGMNEIISPTDNFISSGMRMAAKGSIRTVYRGFKSNFPLESSLGQYERVISFDDDFYGLNLLAFKDVGGFSDEYLDYKHYLDDYFCKIRRDKGMHCIFTNETAVAHPLVREKPNGQFEFNGEKNIFFADRWMKTPYVHTKCLKEEVLSEEPIKMR